MSVLNPNRDGMRALLNREVWSGSIPTTYNINEEGGGDGEGREMESGKRVHIEVGRTESVFSATHHHVRV